MRLDQYDFLPAPYARAGRMGRMVFTGSKPILRGWLIEVDAGWIFLALNHATKTCATRREIIDYIEARYETSQNRHRQR